MQSSHPILFGLALGAAGSLIAAAIVGCTKWGKGKAVQLFGFFRKTRPRTNLRIVQDPHECTWGPSQFQNKSANFLSAKLAVTCAGNFPAWIIQIYIKKPHVQGHMAIMHGSQPKLPGGAPLPVLASFLLEPAIGELGKPLVLDLVLIDQLGDKHTARDVVFRPLR